MRKFSGVVFAVLATALLLGTLLFPPSVYEESPPPFGTAAVHSRQEFPDPVAGLLALGGFVCLGVAALFFRKEIGRGIRDFREAFPPEP